MFAKKIWNTIILDAAVLYAVSPVMIFLLGWTKRPIAVVCCILCIYFMIHLMKELSGSDDSIDITDHKFFWLISGLVLILWVLFSGIGGFSYQTGDFFVRNPMFHDLLENPWPVYFDMSAQPPLVHEVLGSENMGTATYVYYFAWWLPVAAFTKLFHWNRAVSEAALLVWAFLGIFLTYYCLVRYLKKYSYWILAAFVLFGGMDLAVYVFTHLEFPINGHVEWWAGYFQYSASSCLLYWVFNQSIPVWLILSLLLLTHEKKRRLGLCSLAFAYSPFATIGMVPIAIVSCLKNKRGQNVRTILKDIVTAENIGIPVMMLVIFGSFYTQNDNSLGQTGFLLSLHPEFRVFTVYIFFLMMEVMIYFILVGGYARKWQYYQVTLGELILIPLYVAGKYNDFAMRASIPAVFLMMVMILCYLVDHEIKAKDTLRRRILVIVVMTGFLTSVVELQRNVTITLTSAQKDYIKDPVVSFGNMQTNSESEIQLVFDQYLSVDYEDSFFHKYIAER